MTTRVITQVNRNNQTSGQIINGTTDDVLEFDLGNQNHTILNGGNFPGEIRVKTGSLTVNGNLAAHTYNVAAGATLNLSNLLLNNASGGTETEITQNGTNYTVHSFTSNGSFNTAINITGAGTVIGPEVEYLVLGGAGQGGTGHAGAGAGGGEVLEGTTNITSSSLNVIIGDGGEGGTGSPTYLPAGNGSSSSLGNITAQGGGRGGSVYSSGGIQSVPAGIGGGETQMGGTVAPKGAPNPNGYIGGESSHRSQIYQPTAGGGAGAGGDGGNGTFGTNGDSGDGGVGITTNITGTPTEIAGGGGGGVRNDWASTQAGSASHGGGVGGRGAKGGDGQANRGAGGGGGSRRNNGITYPGGKGSTGWVVVRRKR